LFLRRKALHENNLLKQAEFMGLSMSHSNDSKFEYLAGNCALIDPCGRCKESVNKSKNNKEKMTKFELF
jgi:hypothetical protein